MISIIIPAKNEAEGIRKIIKSVKPYAREIIVVDGHSSDNTKQIVDNEKVSYLLDNGLGKGDGVRLGIKKAKGEIIIIFDADGSINEKDIPSLLSPIYNQNADLVIASRRTGGSFDYSLNFNGLFRTMGSDLLVSLVNHRFKTNFSDILYSFRAFKKSSIEKLDLKSNGFEIEQELVVKSLKRGLNVIEIPSRENARAWGTPKLKTITGVRFLVNLIIELYL